MKLKVRTLNNTEAEVDVSQDALLSDVKKKVEEVMPHLDATRQLLIHQGKILSDSMKLSDYPSIKEGDKLVVMLPKSKQAATAKSTETTTTALSSSTAATVVPPTSSSDSSSVPTPAPSFSSTPPAPSPPSDAATTQQPAPAAEATTTEETEPSAQVAPESALVVGQELEQTVSNICAMGFERDQVLRALHAAFNNPDRAVEYLMTGIPSRPEPTPTPQPATTEPTSEAPAAGEAPATTTATVPPTAATQNAPPTSGGRLDVLRQHPLFEQIRAALQANPQLLPGMLQMISQQNPELTELIVNNQAEFLQMMSEGERGPGGAMGGLGGPVTIQVTPEQQEKVRHLEGLGFPEGAAVQALVVCDWDEDRAANFLFDNAGDFDDGDEEDAPMS